MANTYDFLGAFKNDFMKSSLDVYTNISGAMQYCGATENEKTISPGIEVVEWYSNAGGTQTLFALDIDKIDLRVNFEFKQVNDANVIALALNADKVDTDAAKTWAFLGSAPNTFVEAAWMFTGRGVDGRTFSLYIRRGICYATGDLSMGAPGSYTNIPVTVRALQDTTITDTKRDLAYFMIDKRTVT